jgi:hypothetical protein
MWRRCVCGLALVVACGGGSHVDPAPEGDAGASSAPDAGAAADDASTEAAGSDRPYDHDGPIGFDVDVEHVTTPAHSFDVTVYMPRSAGAHPAVSHSCGSSQSAAGYVPYGKRLASYGIAMILRDDPGALTKTADFVDDAVYVVDTWIPQALAGKVDPARVGLSGHSRGGAVSLIATERLKAKARAWFGLDPVDNQFFMDPGVYARTDLASLGVPTAFLGASVTSNCAPAADSYPMLYPKAPSPSVLVVGKGAGHTELELLDACSACNICSPSGTADPNVVLAYAVRYTTAFFARELLGDASVGKAFEGAGGPDDVAAGRVTIESK